MCKMKPKKLVCFFICIFEKVQGNFFYKSKGEEQSSGKAVLLYVILTIDMKGIDLPCTFIDFIFSAVQNDFEGNALKIEYCLKKLEKLSKFVLIKTKYCF